MHQPLDESDAIGGVAPACVVIFAGKFQPHRLACCTWRRRLAGWRSLPCTWPKPALPRRCRRRRRRQLRRNEVRLRPPPGGPRRTRRSCRAGRACRSRRAGRACRPRRPRLAFGARRPGGARLAAHTLRTCGALLPRFPLRARGPRGATGALTTGGPGQTRHALRAGGTRRALRALETAGQRTEADSATMTLSPRMRDAPKCRRMAGRSGNLLSSGGPRSIMAKGTPRLKKIRPRRSMAGCTRR